MISDGNCRVIVGIVEEEKQPWFLLVAKDAFMGRKGKLDQQDDGSVYALYAVASLYTGTLPTMETGVTGQV